MKNLLFCFSVQSILLLCRIPALGQESSPGTDRNYGWLDVGIGPIGSTHTQGEAMSFSLSHLSSFGLLTVRYVHGESGGISYPEFFTTDYPTLNEVGALYGRAIRTDFIVLSASAGLGYVWGDYFQETRSIGIPLSVEAFINVFPVFGVGGKAMMNFNDGSSFEAFSLCLRVGRLRYINMSKPAGVENE